MTNVYVFHPNFMFSSKGLANKTVKDKALLFSRQQQVLYKVKVKDKGKVLPRTGHEGPEGEQICSSTLPSTSALDGGGRSTPRPGRFTPGKDPVPIVNRRLGGPQGRSGRLRKISLSTGIRSPDRPTRSESLYRLSYPGFERICASIIMTENESCGWQYKPIAQGCQYFVGVCRRFPK